MISTRYSLPVAILLGLALVPTVIHSYAGAKASDRLTTEAIGNRFGGYVATATARKSDYIKNTFDSDDWIEREYAGEDGRTILLFAARSYDLKRLYHHPELGILYGVDMISKGIANIGDKKDIPVQLFNRRTGKGAAGYALLYNGEFVRNPVKLQLISSIEQLFNPRKQMTLFFVYDDELPGDESLDTSAAGLILEQAIQSFQLQGKQG